MTVAFTPIFLWLLLIALVCLAVYIAGRAGIHIGRGKLGWLLAGYFAVLICSPVVLWLLPPEMLSHPVDAAALRKAEAAARDLFPAAMAGRPESVDGVRKLGEWQFSLDGDSLRITGSRPYLGLNVLVERKDENDGIIEATHYFTATILEMIDVSAQVRPVEVTLAGNLIITEPEHYHYNIEVIRFRQDFMAAQILGDGVARRQFRIDAIGEQLLYLRVPQDVQIEEAHYHLHFVNKDQP
ncbi:MAG: hypothetical protein DDT30_00674 [Dehalococcoidia bacterium]|nr:hypothetical protein [Bacillota bacterium]MBT9143365.1 hypothetical protein [Bacillota bacterium]